MADFGLMMFATDYSIQPVELATSAEDRGFESIFFVDHTHIPVRRTTRSSPSTARLLYRWRSQKLKAKP